MIKALLYFCIVLSAFAFFFWGANVGYIIGYDSGIDDFILEGIKSGNVYCHYLKEPGAPSGKSCTVR